jgi:hypothetical protein
VALQGDLESFALPDVLRLLAATGKTGRLDVHGAAGGGEVWFLDGGVVGGEASAAPNSTDPAEVVYELLRMGQGAFEFSDQPPALPGEPRIAIEAVLEDAGAMLDRWTEVERIVPGLDVWVSPTPELTGVEITLTSSEWRTLVGLRGGASVRDVGDRLSMSDLGVCEAVKSLVERGAAEIGAALPAPVAEPAEPTDYFGLAEPTARERLDALAATYVDAAPVELAGTDEALLPEPLPVDGTAFGTYDYDGTFGEVDGLDHLSAPADPAFTPLAQEAAYEPAAPMAEALPQTYEAAVPPVPDALPEAIFDPSGLVVEEPPVEPNWDAPVWDGPSWDTPIWDGTEAPGPVAERHAPAATAPPVAELPMLEPVADLAPEPEPEVDPYGGLANLSPEAAHAIAATADDRGYEPPGAANDGEDDAVDRSSLLRFLSTVKN